MKHERRQSHIPALAVLVVFALFAVCVLLVLLTGAESYAALVQRGEESYYLRTGSQYVTTRVWQAPGADSLTVEDFSGCSALVLREEIEGEIYLTRVYCYDGYLRELFSAEGGAFSPGDGEKLIPMTDAAFSLEQQTLHVTLSVSRERSQSLVLSLPRGKEALP